MRSQLSSFAANGWIAEEPERRDRTSASKGALLQPLQSMFWSRSPTQTNDGTSQIDHDILYKVSIFPGLFLNSGKI